MPLALKEPIPINVEHYFQTHPSRRVLLHDMVELGTSIASLEFRDIRANNVKSIDVHASYWAPHPARYPSLQSVHLVRIPNRAGPELSELEHNGPPTLADLQDRQDSLVVVGRYMRKNTEEDFDWYGGEWASPLSRRKLQAARRAAEPEEDEFEETDAMGFAEFTTIENEAIDIYGNDHPTPTQLYNAWIDFALHQAKQTILRMVRHGVNFT